jgi:hypothetical protein
MTRQSPSGGADVAICNNGKSCYMSAETPEAPLAKRKEFILAVVLSAAGLLTSFASYQATLWDGDQASAYTRTGVQRALASRAAADANTLKTSEVSLFLTWLNAKAAGNDRLAAFYAARFPDEFRPAFDGWVAQSPLTNPDAPTSPFAMPTYVQPAVQRAREFDLQAEASLRDGEIANRVSDAFVRASVTLGMAMFFSGISQVFERPPIEKLFLWIAILSCLLGAFQILSLPMQFPAFGEP